MKIRGGGQPFILGFILGKKAQGIQSPGDLKKYKAGSGKRIKKNETPLKKTGSQVFHIKNQ